MLGEQALGSLERAVNGGAWAYDPSTRSLWWSAGMRSLFGLSERAPSPSLEEMLLRHCTASSRARIEQLLEQTLNSALAWDTEIEVLAHGGETRLVRALGEPARNAAGDVIGLVGTMVAVDTQRRADIERERLQTLLRQSEARWRFALEGGGYGVWDYDLRTGTMYQTVPIETLLGYEAGEFRDKIADVRQRTPAEDLARSDLDLSAHFKGRTPVFVNERRVRCRDGSYRWLQFRGRVVERDEQGRPLRMVGTFLDIDARKRGERAQREREQRFRAIFHSTFQLMALIRPDGVLLEVNAPAQRELGFDAVQSIGLPLIEVLGNAGFIDADKVGLLSEALRQAAAGTFVRRSIDCRCRSGALALDCSLKPIVDEQGQVSLIVAEARDVTALRTAELAQRDSEERFRLIFERAPIGIAFVDLEGRVIAVNETFADIVGYPSEELESGVFYQTLQPAEETASHLDDVRDLIAGRITGLRREGHCIRKDGQWIDAQIDIALARENGDIPSGFIVQVQDITERKRTAEALFNEKELAQVTLASIADGVIRTDHAGRISYSNAAAARLLGRRHQDIDGQPFEEVVQLFSERTQEPLPGLTRLLADVEADGTIRLPAFTLLQTASGDLKPVEDSIAPLRDREGRRIGHVFVFHDVSQTRALASQLLYQASHDPLTGLPNRREFETELTSKLFSARARDITHALLYLDLDRFKLVNDTCGHSAGDRMLRELARELRRKLRSADLIARIGGDEFAVLLDSCPVGRALQIAMELVEVLEGFRFTDSGRTFQIGVSIGVAVIDAQASDINQVLSRADTACYIAKRRGRNRVQLYERSDEEVMRAQQDMDWVARIEAALDEGRFELHAQRIQPFSADAPPCYEVLVRQRDSVSSIVMPADFLPAAQRFGLMNKIDREVVRRALNKIHELERMRNRPHFGYLSINLSGTSLSDIEFLNFLQRELEARNTPPERVRFEITETAAVHDLAAARGFISGLRSQGYKILLDDFGTGFTSFEYLKSLEVDGIKIDQSFTRALATDSINQAIVESICRIAQRMRLEVIAEGVEDADALRTLKALGVGHGQGWLFHKAAPIDEVLPSGCCAEMST